MYIVLFSFTQIMYQLNLLCELNLNNNYCLFLPIILKLQISIFLFVFVFKFWKSLFSLQKWYYKVFLIYQ